ncbi:hypothetical protein [Acinetobacter pittii]|jgi:hypothetical protein|uniref:hypothetical protein n=1 Tax=Acinetobacter pittii TaxID=48296 RepID=UPI0021CD5FBD|nr:hypothetical protein [Acinetobacter pittii]MCU4334195.1 hypothetical protein [Acinetobacter pittii]MDQ9887483.1 hypothetical protein [Acinetobacter pittii]
MKKIILLGFIFLPAFTLAKPVQQVSDSVHEQNCRTIMEIAHVIMEERQNGVPLSKALENNDNIFKKIHNKNLEKLYNSLTRDAYEQPSYSTPSIKQEQLNEFSAKHYLGCMAIND